jgi:GntR family transcriptional regulator
VTDPMYRQIAGDLQRQIESGELARGSQLPTELELREQYDASRNTVRDAIKWLTTRGLVETRPGQGTFVTERIIPFVTTLSAPAGGGEERVYLAEVVASRRKPRISDPRVEIQLASQVVAEALLIKPGAQVVSRHQRRFIDDIPWSLQTSFYPMSLVARGATKLIEATDIPDGVVFYLANECGIKQTAYRDTISVRPPNENETAFFKLPADGRVAVFTLFRVGYDQKGDRFRLTITIYPTDRNRLLYNQGPVPPPPSAEANQGPAAEAGQGPAADPDRSG